MHLECSACHHVLEFSTDRPVFCAYCGQPIDSLKPITTVECESEAATVPPSDSTEDVSCSVPEVVGGYRLLRPLGSGGMGTVYEAEETCSGCRVALKLIAPEFAISKEAMQRFRQEGRLASTIVHPRCVFVLAADEEAGQPYIAMELMPGTTLQDLVKERGALSVEEAVAKILDVIDGLQEVHRLGLIHRDIKPSNCFLEADGRVKIGDFGLSKSLIRDSHLTKTGLFLGTPLYASPEQIKMERADRQSDVYAVAATLYFLLTGRAPHQTGDTTATVARIVSDPVASLRTLRKEIPAALDKVVLRGLERDRKHRWKSLDEFRAALAPFVRRQLSIGGIGIRVCAFLVDGLLLGLLQLAIPTALIVGSRDPLWRNLIDNILGDILWIVYFTVMESVWGGSLGKRWLRLRVYAVGSGAQLGMARALLRTLIFYGLVALGGTMIAFLRYACLPSDLPRELQIALGPLSSLLWLVVGIMVAGCTMRKRNGYRALHDLLSGSRVVQLPWPVRQRKWRKPAQELAVFSPEGLPECIGHLTIKGAIHWTEEERLLLAEDTVLARKVWLWLRPRSAPPLSEARREVARPARLRWLTSGHAEDWQWHAFLAPPAGWPLPRLLAQEKQLCWAEVRPLLEQLTEELVASSRDGTLPDCLTLGQVWLQPDGQVQLLDTAPEFFPDEPQNGFEADVHRRALGVLRAVAVYTLEGRPRPATDGLKSIRTPAPGHAARMLDRLVGVTEPYQRVEEFQADLQASSDRPTRVTRGLRMGQLVLQGLLLFLGFSVGVTFPIGLWLLPIVWVAWATLFRGGLTLHLMGLVLLDRNGQIASRLRCGWRAFLVWLPFIVVNFGYVAWMWGTRSTFSPRESALLIFIALMGLYLVLGLVWPSRGPHDRLVGIYLVPG